MSLPVHLLPLLPHPYRLPMVPTPPPQKPEHFKDGNQVLLLPAGRSPAASHSPEREVQTLDDNLHDLPALALGTANPPLTVALPLSTWALILLPKRLSFWCLNTPHHSILAVFTFPVLLRGTFFLTHLLVFIILPRSPFKPSLFVFLKTSCLSALPH